MTQDPQTPPAPRLPSEGGAWIISGTELIREPKADAPEPLPVPPLVPAPDTPEKEA